MPKWVGKTGRCEILIISSIVDVIVDATRAEGVVGINEYACLRIELLHVRCKSSPAQNDCFTRW